MTKSRKKESNFRSIDKIIETTVGFVAGAVGTQIPIVAEEYRVSFSKTKTELSDIYGEYDVSSLPENHPIIPYVDRALELGEIERQMAFDHPFFQPWNVLFAYDGEMLSRTIQEFKPQLHTYPDYLIAEGAYALFFFSLSVFAYRRVKQLFHKNKDEQVKLI